MSSIRLTTATTSSIPSDVDNILSHWNIAYVNSTTLRAYCATGAYNARKNNAMQTVCDVVGIHLQTIRDICTTIINTFHDDEYNRTGYINSFRRAAGDLARKQNIVANSEVVRIGIEWCVRTTSDTNVSNMVKRATNNSSVLLSLKRSTDDEYVKNAITALYAIVNSIAKLNEAIEIANVSLKKASSIHNYPEYIQIVMDLLIDNGHQHMVDYVLGLPSGTNDFRPLGNIYRRASATAKIAIENFIRYIRLNGLNMAGCDFSGIDLNNVDLSGVKLTNAKFVGANLSSCRIAESDIEGVDFSNANLDDAYIFLCSIIGSTFRKCTLRRTSFRASDIMRSDFSGSRMQNTSFTRLNIQSSSFSNIHGICAITSVTINDCDFTSANITESSINGSTIERCDFSDATLDNVNSIDNVIIRNKYNNNTKNPRVLCNV